eukprot:1393950-Prymnesium_polylepis.1
MPLRAPGGGGPASGSSTCDAASCRSSTTSSEARPSWRRVRARQRNSSAPGRPRRAPSSDCHMSKGLLCTVGRVRRRCAPQGTGSVALGTRGG